MARPDINRYQARIVEALRRIFGPHIVQAEWSATREVPGIYSPRIDIAVGPFATIHGIELTHHYDNIAQANSDLLRRLIDMNVTNFRENQNDNLQQRIVHQFPTLDSLDRFNQNARCFMSIEIENRVSRKHLLGGVVNASTLARVAIIIPWTNENMRAIVRLLQYWDYLRYVRKNTFDPENVLVLTNSQLLEAIQSVDSQT